LPLGKRNNINIDDPATIFMANHQRNTLAFDGAFVLYITNHGLSRSVPLSLHFMELF